LKSAAFSLKPRPPFRLDLTVWALRRRPDNQVDNWDGETYRRALALDGKLYGKVVEVAVTQTSLPDAPRIEARVSGAQLTSGVKSAVTEALDRLLGLKVNLSGFYRLAAGDRRLESMAERFRGLKPPRFPTVFEALVNGIACQQVTLTLGIRLLNCLAENYGAVSAASQLHAFPQPSGLAGLKPEKLKRLKFSRQKARALIELSNAVVEGEFNPEEMAFLDDEAAVARLLQLWGVGRWTAEYALLRGQGWTYFAQWGGVAVADLIELCHPSPEAKYLVFRTMDDKWERPGRGCYYEVIDLALARKPQTILAYEMNDEPRRPGRGIEFYCVWPLPLLRRRGFQRVVARFHRLVPVRRGKRRLRAVRNR